MSHLVDERASADPLRVAAELSAGGADESDEWIARVDRVLAGRSFEEVLVGSTRDGIKIQPLYVDSARVHSTARRVRDCAHVEENRSASWDIRQHHRGTDPGRIRELILDDLGHGVTSIELGPGSVVDDLASVLDGVRMGETPIGLGPHAELAWSEALVELATRQETALAPNSSLGFDPIGEWARSGRQMDPTLAARLVERLRGRGGFGAGVRVLAVDVTRPVAAGATEVQALAWAAAAGSTYLRVLVEAGLSVSSAAGRIGFRLATSADQFVTIAMLRAARVMWSRVVTASGGTGPAACQFQHAVTTEAMYSRRDPWVNLLRGTTAALAAAVGGADAVTVLPFDHATGPLMGGLGPRMARNTQLLLAEESHLGRAIDPAGGSFFVESLTHQLADRGWQAFQAIEAAGGIMTVLADGTMAEAIDSSWSDRLAGLRTRREVVTGVSDFPSSTGDPVGSTGDSQNSVGDLGRHPGRGLPVRRLAQPYEDLRDAADRHLGVSGRRPTVAVVALGSEAAHSPRTTWARNLLAGGGIEAEGGHGDGAFSPIAAAAGFGAVRTPVAVITSSDQVYAEQAAATATAVVEAGATLVAMVGDPGDRRADLAGAGVDEFWCDGMDVLAALQRLHDMLHVTTRPPNEPGH